jgi:phosphatidylglycerol lysyltransferase
VALVEREGRVLAFANLWPGADRAELSVDLMRYHHDAPDGVMEGLLIHLLKWAKQEGYRSFSLGMAPLSGFEQSPIAPLWSQLGSFVYKHGEAFYKFQGLRAYKEKFHPRWEPRYSYIPAGSACRGYSPTCPRSSPAAIGRSC